MRHISVLLIFTALAWAATQAHSESPPTPALANALQNTCKPVFQIDGRSSPAGTAFVLQAPPPARGDVLVAAHHLFGLASANSDGMPWQDTPRRVRSADCRSLDGRRIWRTGPAAAILGVHAFRSMPDVHDVAVLPVLAGSPSHLALSPTGARVGDIVWLVAKTDDRPNQFLYRARVIANRDYLAFVYDDATLHAANISGAPIVTGAGKVVGVNVGVGRLPNGALVGVADTLTTLQSALRAARSR
jgi:hypothetical protein